MWWELDMTNNRKKTSGKTQKDHKGKGFSLPAFVFWDVDYKCRHGYSTHSYVHAEDDFMAADSAAVQSIKSY